MLLRFALLLLFVVVALLLCCCCCVVLVVVLYLPRWVPLLLLLVRRWWSYVVVICWCCSTLHAIVLSSASILRYCSFKLFRYGWLPVDHCYGTVITFVIVWRFILLFLLIVRLSWRLFIVRWFDFHCRWLLGWIFVVVVALVLLLLILFDAGIVVETCYSYVTIRYCALVRWYILPSLLLSRWWRFHCCCCLSVVLMVIYVRLHGDGIVVDAVRLFVVLVGIVSPSLFLLMLYDCWCGWCCCRYHSGGNIAVVRCWYCRWYIVGRTLLFSSLLPDYFHIVVMLICCVVGDVLMRCCSVGRRHGCCSRTVLLCIVCAENSLRYCTTLPCCWYGCCSVVVGTVVSLCARCAVVVTLHLVTLLIIVPRCCVWVHVTLLSFILLFSVDLMGPVVTLRLLPSFVILRCCYVVIRCVFGVRGVVVTLTLISSLLLVHVDVDSLRCTLFCWHCCVFICDVWVVLLFRCYDIHCCWSLYCTVVMIVHSIVLPVVIVVVDVIVVVVAWHCCCWSTLIRFVDAFCRRCCCCCCCCCRYCCCVVLLLLLLLLLLLMNVVALSDLRPVLFMPPADVDIPLLCVVVEPLLHLILVRWCYRCYWFVLFLVMYNSYHYSLADVHG